MVRIEKEDKRMAAIRPPPPQKFFCSDCNELMERKYQELGLEKFSRVIPSDEKKVEASMANDADFYLKEEAFDKILKHCYEMAADGKEAMGFLIGDVRKWESMYSIAFDVATSSLDASPYRVRFSRDAFEELFDKLDEIEYEYIIVGWYHSHVGYTSFMSDIDLETQRKYFNKPFHIAMVVDPINMEAKSFKLMNERCIEIPYIIF